MSVRIGRNHGAMMMRRRAERVATALLLGIATAAQAASPPGPPVFPDRVSAKYAKETPGKARLHTCLDQYRANKAAGANGGLSWIQKGGGYYSACGRKLAGK